MGVAKGRTLTSKETKRRSLRASYPKAYNPKWLRLAKRGLERLGMYGDEEGKQRSKEED